MTENVEYKKPKERNVSIDGDAGGSKAPITREDLIFRPGLSNTEDLKRYTLVIPQDLYDEVQRLADERQTTVVDLFRRFIRLGLLAMYIQEKPDAALVIKEGDTEQRLLML